MKKGFTLIELLAVILILGIIALIAIPTVNKILEEARYGVFKTTSENIMKAMEQHCQISSIKGENPNLLYTLNDGKINVNIDVKGNLPENGYVYLDNECTVEEFYLKQNKYVYSNVSEENYKTNYMLKAPINSSESIFKTLYPGYYSNLLSINFVNHLNIPENAIEIKDPSVSEKGKIKSWIVPNGSSYDLFIGSLNKIYANYDASYLIADSSAIELDIDNLYTDFTKSFRAFFYKAKFTVLDLKQFKTDNATTFLYFFHSCNSLTQLDVSNWNTSNVTIMTNIFYACNSLEILDLRNWNMSNVTDMSLMFNDCFSLKEIKGIENFDLKSIKIMHTIFDSCRSLISLDLSKWNTANINNITKLFSDDNYIGMNIETINLSNWNLKKVTLTDKLFYYNDATKNIIMKNSDYYSINLIINNIPDRTSKESGTIDITGVDDISRVDVSIAQSKNWVVIS